MEQYTEVDPERAAELRNAVMERLSPHQQAVLARDLQSPTRSLSDARETTPAQQQLQQAVFRGADADTIAMHQRTLARETAYREVSEDIPHGGLAGEADRIEAMEKRGFKEPGTEAVPASDKNDEARTHTATSTMNIRQFAAMMIPEDVVDQPVGIKSREDVETEGFPDNVAARRPGEQHPGVANELRPSADVDPDDIRAFRRQLAGREYTVGEQDRIIERYRRLLGPDASPVQRRAARLLRSGIESEQVGSLAQVLTDAQVDDLFELNAVPMDEPFPGTAFWRTLRVISRFFGIDFDAVRNTFRNDAKSPIDSIRG